MEQEGQPSSPEQKPPSLASRPWTPQNPPGLYENLGFPVALPGLPRVPLACSASHVGLAAKKRTHGIYSVKCIH